MSEKNIPQKLFLKENHRFLLIDPPQNYRNLLGRLPDGVALLEKPVAPVDLIQVFARNRSELAEKIATILPLMTEKVVLWVSYIKGTSKIKTDINRDEIAAYAQTLGLQAVAIIALDQDWAALRLKKKS